MKRNTKLFFIAAVTLSLIGVITAVIATRSDDSKRLVFMLNIPSVPESLRVSSCESGPWTDVVITCAIEVDPAEFPLLLKGYTFSKSESNESSYTLGVPQLGPEFAVAGKYEAKPASFKNGGMVRVFADVLNKRAVVDLYIE